MDFFFFFFFYTHVRSTKIPIYQSMHTYTHALMQTYTGVPTLRHILRWPPMTPKSTNQPWRRSHEYLDVTPQRSPALIKPGCALEGGNKRAGTGKRRCRGRCQKLPCYCGTSYCQISTAPGWCRPTPRPDWCAGSRLLAPYDFGWSSWTGCP